MAFIARHSGEEYCDDSRIDKLTEQAIIREKYMNRNDKLKMIKNCNPKLIDLYSVILESEATKNPMNDSGCVLQSRTYQNDIIIKFL